MTLTGSSNWASLSTANDEVWFTIQGKRVTQQVRQELQLPVEPQAQHRATPTPRPTPTSGSRAWSAPPTARCAGSLRHGAPSGHHDRAGSLPQGPLLGERLTAVRVPVRSPDRTTTGWRHEGLGITALDRGGRPSASRGARPWAAGAARPLALVAVAALITACTRSRRSTTGPCSRRSSTRCWPARAPARRSVVVQSEATVNAGGETESRDPRDLQAMVPDEVAARLGPPGPGPHRDRHPTTSATSRRPGRSCGETGACEHVDVLSGACPQATGRDPGQRRRRRELRPRPRLDRRRCAPVVDGPTSRLEVVGTYAPRDADWWQGQHWSASRRSPGAPTRRPRTTPG